MTIKPSVGAFLFGLPEYETLFPFLQRLNERGNLEPKVFLPTSLCRSEPRTRKLLDDTQMTYRALPSKVIKYFYRGCFRELNAVVSLSDPFLDQRRAHRRRNRYLVNLNLPNIYFQHGVVQPTINRGSPLQWGYKSEKIDYYSTAVFHMVYPDETQRKYFSKTALSRIDATGFIKKPCFTPNPVQSIIADELSKYDVRLLICHSLHDNSIVSEEQYQPYYAMLKQFAKNNPQVGILLRSHRGRLRKGYKDYDQQIDKECSNVFLMYKHHGPFKRMVMTDALSISDMVISTPSTAILDAIYMGKPTAVSFNFHKIFSDMFQITNATSIEQFVRGFGNHQEGAANLITRYGKFEDNIEQACEKVEHFVNRSVT